MEQYNFNEFDKIIISETDNSCTAHYCNEHGVYLKLKGVSNYKCPWCGLNNPPINNLKELRIKYLKELAV